MTHVAEENDIKLNLHFPSALHSVSLADLSNVTVCKYLSCGTGCQQLGLELSIPPGLVGNVSICLSHK